MRFTIKKVADRVRVGVRTLLFVAASGWLALPASHVQASALAQGDWRRHDFAAWSNNGSVAGADVDGAPPVISALSAIARPTLVQHVGGSNAQQQVSVYNLPLPNTVLPGNCLILGVRKDSDNATVTVSDDQNNTYSGGPSISDDSRTVALFYKVNIRNRPRIITVTLSGIGSYWMSVVASEFYNVAAVSPDDGSNASVGRGASLTTNNIATAVDGDLIYNFAAVSGDANSTEMSSWTPGSGHSLLSADLLDRDAAQYTIQTTHGTINSRMTMDPADSWLSVGMALKAAPAGTAPPAGIHVDKVLHNGIPPSWSSETVNVQVPSTGNLLVAIFASEPSATITSISDTAGHAWTSTGPDVDAGSSISGMQYVANASASDTNVVTYTYAVPANGGNTCIVFDISGADPRAPFDKRGTASGDERASTSYIGASVTPATSKGLLISVNAVESNTVFAVSPEIFVASTTTPQISPWPNDENNGYAIQYNVDTSTVTSSWSSDGPVGGWTEVLAAFKSAPTIPLSPAILQDANTGVAYIQTVTASGGIPPYTFSVLSGALPAGLSLNSATGVITGTPTGSGAASFTIQVTDFAGNIGRQSYTVNISNLISNHVLLTFLSLTYDGSPFVDLKGNIFIGRLTLNFTLMNVGPRITDQMYFQITDLTKVPLDLDPLHPNRLLSADNGSGTIGDIQTLHVASLGTNESTPVSFVIGIGSLQRFAFYVDLYTSVFGSPVSLADSVLKGKPGTATRKGTLLGGFQFEVSEGSLGQIAFPRPSGPATATSPRAAGKCSRPCNQ